MSETASNDEGLIHLGAEVEGPAQVTAKVEAITSKIKKVQTTDEGKLQVTLETEGLDDDAIGKVKEMLSLQQSTLVKVDMRPVQRELFNDG